MKFSQSTSSYRFFSWKITPVLLLIMSLWISTAHAADSAVNTFIWDTVSPFADAMDLQNKNRGDWKLVPPDLLTLEEDPATASSDPGYYGREYEFEGDAVIENAHVIAAFWSLKGKIVIRSKASPEAKMLYVVPLQLKHSPTKISHCAILQNTGTDAALEVSFATGREQLSVVIAFDRMGIVQINPAAEMKGISLTVPFRYGVVPSFIGDDLIYNPRDYPSTNALCIPSENVLLGLLEGENDVLVIAWPEGQQRIKLSPSEAPQDSRIIESVDLENDGKGIYLSLLSAPGIWHREDLTPSYLERDVASHWKRPFQAKWITQLEEAGVKTTFTFKEAKQARIWRGVAGSYCHPIWFDKDFAHYHLSKKVLPKGESIVYFLEARNTPASIFTPVEIMKATLGRQTCDRIFDIPGRKLRTHHRRGAAGIRRACTCGCTEAIEAVFHAGEEVQKQQYVNGAVDDMVYFVRRHMERLDEYQDFARMMVEYLNHTKRSSAALKSYLDNIEAIVQQLPQEYENQRENIKTLRYADELAIKTKALTRKKDPGNLPACLELGKQWRAMGGAQDSLLGMCHTITRKLFQEAGYSCANQPEAVEMAKEIRRRCTACLRNADGYEIWADY